jgi:hypothetical protein
MVSNSAVNEIVSLGSCDCWPSIFRSFESPVFSRQFLQGVILKEAKHDVKIVVAKKLSIDELHVYCFFLDRYLSDTHKVYGKAQGSSSNVNKKYQRQQKRKKGSKLGIKMGFSFVVESDRVTEAIKRSTLFLLSQH